MHTFIRTVGAMMLLLVPGGLIFLVVVVLARSMWRIRQRAVASGRSGNFREMVSGLRWGDILREARVTYG